MFELLIVSALVVIVGAVALCYMQMHHKRKWQKVADEKRAADKEDKESKGKGKGRGRAKEVSSSSSSSLPKAHLRDLKGHQKTVNCARFVGNSVIVSCADDRCNRIWQSVDGTFSEKNVHFSLLPRDADCGAVLSVDNDFVAISMRHSRQIVVYRIAQPKSSKSKSSKVGTAEASRFESGFDALGAERLCLASKFVVLSSSEKPTTFRLFNRKGKLLVEEATQAMTLHDLAVSPDARHVAVATFNASMRVYSIDTDSKSGAFRALSKAMLLSGHRSEVKAVDFVSATRLVTAARDGTIRLWDIDRSHWPGSDPICTLVIDAHELGVLADRRDAFTMLRVSPNERHVIAVRGRNMAIFSLDDGTLASRIDNAHQYPIASLSFAPDSSLLATVGGENFVRLWHFDQMV
jgi:transducin beta-like protein 2